jgi:zona occludens toxin (predicted ATPase)
MLVSGVLLYTIYKQCLTIFANIFPALKNGEVLAKNIKYYTKDNISQYAQFNHWLKIGLLWSCLY